MKLLRAAVLPEAPACLIDRGRRWRPCRSHPLFAAPWLPVAGYARRFLADATLADELAQDALAKLGAAPGWYEAPAVAREVTAHEMKRDGIEP